MPQRLDLHNILKKLLGTDNVYFQPPPNVVMNYPAIVYRRSDIQSHYADNVPYRHKTRYQVTVISKDPDNEITKKVADLPMCSYDRFFTADNLNHDIYNLFF